MENKGISQEGLKSLACLTMLLDHLGAVFFPGIGLRMIGRMAFPIYCFLLTEGVAHTSSKGRYGLRLALGALFSELPFDLFLFGRPSMAYQSVMLTLLLGFGMAVWMERGRWKVMPLLVCGLAAELLRTDYGFGGVSMIWIFLVTRELPNRIRVQLPALAVLCVLMPGMSVSILGISVPVELFALLALVPIGFYSGRKQTRSKTITWGFYLFYPLHLTILWILRCVLL